MNQKRAQSPNLLRKAVRSTFVSKHHKDITTFLKISIIIIEAVFVFILAMDSKVKIDINYLNKKIEFQGKLISEQHELESKTRDIISRTEHLKKLQSERKLLSFYAEKIISFKPQTTDIKYLKLNASKSTLEITTRNPLQISLLITKYLEDGFAKEIVLESAILDKFTNEFEVAIEVKFQ